MYGFAASPKAWSTIQRLAARPGPKKAAVSYVTSDQIIKFGRHDLLVCDASDDAVRAGVTSGGVIQRAIGRGARVVSVDQLHSKVMLFDNTVVVGSTNISVRSASQLCEAILYTARPSIVRKVSAWIDELAARGDLIDESRLAMILAIDARRAPIQRRFRSLADPHIVFFKEVMRGDIAKYSMQSSTAGTGGGARDLRIGRAAMFGPLLSQILSEPTDEQRGVTHGSVLSRIGGRRLVSTDVELWRPTHARPNEVRIARFYDVPGWGVSRQDLTGAQATGRRLFYVLEMDVHGSVTAKVLSDRELQGSNPLIGAHIERLAARTRRGRSIVGAVDVIGRITVP